MLNRQPHMRAALDALNETCSHFNQASDDKGGHRTKALDHTRQAIDETEAGIQFDNRN